MQTFLPYPSWIKSAQCLDYRRLNKQRVEAYQILEILAGKESRWSNHPAVLMWQGYEEALTNYYSCVCREWIKRGYKQILLPILLPYPFYRLPDWFADPAFHASHRSNLLRKLPEWYSQFNWTEPDNLPYMWPI